MRTFVVVPCLNEELTVARTCRSLGFCHQLSTPPEATLILVDNGSTDKTVDVIAEVARECNHIVVAHEPTRGYVPPRLRGIQLAREISRSKGCTDDDVLIVQADADTAYRKDYVSAIQVAALTGRNVLFHGRTELPADFLAEHVAYADLCSEADEHVRALRVHELDSVIVDDKVSAYWLSDYDRWGGLTQECTDLGDDVHAETSRMFLRAKARGARLCYVDAAVASPSRRKVLAEPGLTFATAGYPRDATWIGNWRLAYGPDTFARIYSNDNDRAAVRAERMAHEVMLFGALPCAVARVLKGTVVSHDMLLAPLINKLLPRFTAHDLMHRSSRALIAALHIVDTERSHIEGFIAKQRP